MRQSIYLAIKYLKYHKSRTLILVFCIAVIAFVPMSLRIITSKGEELIQNRAVETQLILGARGSSLDLVMNSLYFQKNIPETIPNSALQEISGFNRAEAIPLYVRFQARNYPIIGTSIDYFPYRKLQFQEGKLFSRLGQCVIGSKVADQLDLTVGGHIVSSPENVFDIAGVYPLRMQVSGVLEHSGTSDDEAIFTDVKTTWLIQGLLHGHEDLGETDDSSVVLSRDSTHVVANAKLYEYNEVTEENYNSFHFHGKTDNYPLTSLILIPRSEKDGTILEGEYLTNADSPYQLIRPKNTIEELLAKIFKTQDLIDGVAIVVGFATILSLILVWALSMKLRSNEMATYFKMGCSQNFIGRLFLSEILIIVVLSMSLVALLYGATSYFVENNPSIIFSF